MRTTPLALVSLVCTVLAAAFSAAGASAENKPHEVSIGTNAEGTATYTLATGLAKVASEKAGMRASVVPEKGADELFRLLNEGKLHFAVADPAGLGAAYVGPNELVGGRKNELPHCPNVRLVMRGGGPGADAYLATHRSASDDEVKRLLQAIWDDAESLQPINPAVNDWKRDRAVSAEMTIPYHPAAVEFYNRKGVWSAKADEAQQRLLQANP
jgi:TRAP-type uncharacterized transport system substrate-binding protein